VHLILAEYPLVQLGDLAGRMCGHVRPADVQYLARGDLAAWWAVRQPGRAPLLVVADDDFVK
jgi:hypothetical protein